MALQDTLSSWGNPAASRNAILQRLGIDPNRAAGFGGNTQFDQRMADLYNQGLQSAASYDTQEGDLNRGYQQNVAKMATDRDRALQLVKGNLAGRGMTYSGAGLDEIGRTNTEYDTMGANAEADWRSGITGIGTNRLNLDRALTSGRQAAESGYGDDLSAFLQQQAIDMWNAVTQQNQQNAMLQAMNRPAPAPAPVRPAAPKPAPRPVAAAPAPIAKPPAVLKGQGYGGRGSF